MTLTSTPLQVAAEALHRQQCDGGYWERADKNELAAHRGWHLTTADAMLAALAAAGYVVRPEQAVAVKVVVDEDRVRDLVQQVISQIQAETAEAK